MEFNIALSSIVYLMVFLFPGIIFRKFYFRGEFIKEFQQGNLMERLLWSIFCSILCLLVSLLVYYISKFKLQIPLLSSISYETVKDVFSTLSSNKLPEREVLKNTYKDFIILISGVYVISMILGSTFSWFVTFFNLDVQVGVLRYRNYWYYLIKGKLNKVEKGDRGQKKRYFSTMADVLVNDGKENILYQGYVDNYYTNGNTNNLESIILKDAHKFVKDVNTNSFIKTPITGNAFTIHSDRIININLVYFYKDRNYHQIRVVAKILLDILFNVILGLLILSFWFDSTSFKLLNFEGTTKKFGFLLFGSLFLTGLRSFILSLIESRPPREILLNFWGVILLAIPATWIYSLISFWWMILSMLILFIILMVVYGENKKETNP